jgi:aldehyde dehydrogenase (NAD+)
MPIVDCETVEDAIEFIRSRDKPLACYVFSNNNKNIEAVRQLVSSGTSYEW